jgi:glycosyltransferase involved in cell wall biosynthesis
MSLRIALLMHSLNPRGGVVHTLALADALCERGHQVTLIAPASEGQRLFRETRAVLSVATLSAPHGNLEPPAFHDDAVDQGQRLSPLATMVATRIDAVARHLRDLPGLDRFDVLHSQDSITANALARLRTEGRIAGFTRTVHHLDTFDDPVLTAWQARGVRDASRVLCVSPLWQGVLKDQWQRDAGLVPNGVDTVRFTPASGDPKQTAQDDAQLRALGLDPSHTGPLWLSVGGIEERKNPERLLRAFAAVQGGITLDDGVAIDKASALDATPKPTTDTTTHPDARLVIAGGASLLDHDAYAACFQATLNALPEATRARVHLTGPLPDAALPALYRRATALAMPSLREGFGLVVLEALACGTPAIVSRIRPFTDHLALHETLWADPLSVVDLARALRISLRTEVRASVLNAAPAVCARFAWSRSAELHERHYRDGQDASSSPQPPMHSLSTLPFTSLLPQEPLHA